MLAHPVLVGSTLDRLPPARRSMKGALCAGAEQKMGMAFKGRSQGGGAPDEGSGWRDL